jgi:hypothetical protein
MDVFKFRKNGGLVEGVSDNIAAFAGIDPTFHGTLIDPAMPDGKDLAVTKIAVGSTVRNATPAEIIAANAGVAADLNLNYRAAAIDWLQNNPIQRKILRAIVSILVDENNLLRDAVVPPLPHRTLPQALTAIVNTINQGTVD